MAKASTDRHDPGLPRKLRGGRSNRRKPGAASWSAEGDFLYSLDVDDDDNFTRMVELNPTFAETLQTNGARGGNFWLYVKGPCPPSCTLFLRDGQRFGEWRGSGMQTIIAGTHPCGRPYTNNAHKPMTAEFSAIRWLETVALPWDMKRPGVSMEFLVAHGVRYVGAEEAKALLGFKPSGGGLWIPYPKLEGEGPLMVNGRAYGCLRLYRPDHDAEYPDSTRQWIAGFMPRPTADHSGRSWF